MGECQKMSYSPSIPRQVFLHPRRLTQQQIQARIHCQESFEEHFPLPCWIASNPVVDSIFSPARDQLWLSAQEGKALFNEVRKLWMRIDGPNPLQSTLAHHNHKRKPIKKAILLGVGRVCGKFWDVPWLEEHQDDAIWVSWKGRVLSRMLQLVVFVCAVEILSQQSDKPIKVFTQEPGFEAVDEEFMLSLGIEVLQMPAAEESVVDHETFVHAPCMVYPNLANTFTRCIKHQPGIYAGHDFGWLMKAVNKFPESVTELPWSREESVERLRAYEKGRAFFDVFPESEYSSTSMEISGLTDTYVHIRKTVPTGSELKQPCTASCKTVPSTSCG